MSKSLPSPSVIRELFTVASNTNLWRRDDWRTTGRKSGRAEVERGLWRERGRRRRRGGLQGGRRKARRGAPTGRGGRGDRRGEWPAPQGARVPRVLRVPGSVPGGPVSGLTGTAGPCVPLASLPSPWLKGRAPAARDISRAPGARPAPRPAPRRALTAPAPAQGAPHPSAARAGDAPRQPPLAGPGEGLGLLRKPLYTDLGPALALSPHPSSTTVGKPT